MTLRTSLKIYGIAIVVFFGLDLIWLGVVAKGFYQQHLSLLMRPDIQWGPALLFYAIFVAALVVFTILPALERQSIARAIGMGAFFGVATYAAYDLTSLALIRDFPVLVAVVDLAWGAVLSATVAAAGYVAGKAWGTGLVVRPLGGG